MKTASSSKTTNELLQKWMPAIAILYLLIWRPSVAGPYISPILFLAVTAYMLYHFINGSETIPGKKPLLHVDNGLPTIFFLMCLGWSVFIQHHLLKHNPIDIAKSDIIPLIRDIYCKRFSQGEFVYAHVNGYDYVSWTPNYLPFHWLPFVPAFQIGFDPRWVAFAILQLALLIYSFRVLKSSIRISSKCLYVLLPFFILWLLYKKQSPALTHHVEMLIAGYYLILSLGIISAHRIMKIGGFTLTLLSRYMSLFFLPFAIITDWNKDRKSTLMVYLSIATLLLLFYVIPFLSKDPIIFLSGASAYDVAAAGEWDGQSWQAASDRPYQLFQGYGIACWFWYLFPLQPISGIGALKITLLTVMILLPIIAWFLNKNNRFSKRRIGLALLVLQLAVFPTFSLVPYNYLFWSFLFSLPLLLFEWENTQGV